MKDSILMQMRDLSAWGILTDFRYSYLTMMPAYEANVLDRFADMLDRGMIKTGARPVFWSVKQQRILGEEDFGSEVSLKQAFVTKLGIRKFGAKAAKIKRNYPGAKMLVFTPESWQICAAKAVAINDKLSYILVKQGNEYLILAEKRLGEFIARFANGRQPATQFKTLMVFSGAELADVQLERPFGEPGHLPTVINRELKWTFGTGIQTVTPAHNIDDMRLSYHYNLSRQGCIDPETGFLQSPASLEGTDLVDEDEATARVKRALQDEGQFYGAIPHQVTEYRMDEEDTSKEAERINLVTVDSWFARISDKLKFKCF